MNTHRPSERTAVVAAESPHVTRVDRTLSLDVGTFWRPRAVNDDGTRDDSVVLSEIHLVNGRVHSVQVLQHPRHWHDGGHASYESLLLDAFLAAYEPDPRGQRTRDEDLAEANARVRDEQRLLEDLQSPLGGLAAPALAREDAPDAGSLPAIVRRGVSLEAHHGALSKQAGAVQRALRPVTDLMHEQALIARIRAAAVQKDLRRVEERLCTFGLYTGTNVDATLLADGEPADPGEPLHLFQRRLFMDEESLLNVAYGGADFQDLETFGALLESDPDVLARVAPYPRCVVAMQFRRSDRDYGDAVLNTLMNEQNRHGFLLIRNGARVHAVFSALTYLPRLFPTTDEFDRPFRGYDGRRITPQDLQYPRANSRAERLALYYRRLLVLLWGLYDRTDVIGSFALERTRGHLNLLSPDVQAECFRFVSDEDNVLPDGHPAFNDWVCAHNHRVQSGSRVLCFWKSLLDHDTAPGCFSRHVNTKAELCFTPDYASSIHTVYRRGRRLFVKVQVSGWAPYGWQERSFNAHVEITPGRFRDLPYLCLDAVDPADIDYYLHNRETRVDYLSCAQGLVSARKALAREAEAQVPMVRAVSDALLEGGVLASRDTAENQAREAIRQWRAQHRGRSVPGADDADFAEARDALLHWLWVLNGHGRDRRADTEKVLAREGRSLLELRLSGPRALRALATALAGEPDPRLGTHPFVRHFNVETQKTQVKLKGRGWLLPTALPADQSLIGADTAPAFAGGVLCATVEQTETLLATLRDAWDRAEAAAQVGTRHALCGVPIPLGMYEEPCYGRLEVVFARVTGDKGLKVVTCRVTSLLADKGFPPAGSAMDYWSRNKTLESVLDRLAEGTPLRRRLSRGSVSFVVSWAVRREWAKRIDRALAGTLAEPA